MAMVDPDVSIDRSRSDAELLRAMHKQGDPLVLPNAWDAASAKAFAEAGFGVSVTIRQRTRSEGSIGLASSPVTG